ncbi:MAG: LD-carboxypeptidase [Chitinophagaceae bacterium]
MITNPPYLEKGDTIGMVCPAGYMEAKKVKTCIKTLKKWGFEVKVGTTVGGPSKTYFSGTDKERLEDLQSMMDDASVKAILCGRGGYGMGRIIEKIDFTNFKKHPKWLIGYSDITVFHAHLYSNYYISSLHAPMAAAFQNKGHKNEYVLSLKDALMGKMARYKCEAHPFNRKGQAVGELVGGNLTLLAHIIGTGSDFQTDGKILFIEDVGEQKYNLDRMLYQLKRSGKFDKLAGLIVGGFSETKDTERPFGQKIYAIIKDKIEEYDYPVCFDFPVSHTDRNYALKMGAGYKLVVGRSKVRLEE